MEGNNQRFTSFTSTYAFHLQGGVQPPKVGGLQHLFGKQYEPLFRRLSLKFVSGKAGEYTNGTFEFVAEKYDY